MAGSGSAAGGDVILEQRDSVGLIRLNRPKALNALTLDMIRTIAPQLDTWARDDGVQAVVIAGEGERAFCAGGDVRAIYDARAAGDRTFHAAFYSEEYRLNRAIYRYPKPYVALIDGVTMGGGVGLSVHGSHRVVTERTLFAMPETGIGLFPDVGGGYFLPRCPGAVGIYLGLTGARIGAADCLYAGIGTHYIPSTRHAAVLDSLVEARLWREPQETVTAILDSYRENPGPSALATLRPQIDRHFGRESVPAILDSLAGDDSEWAARTLAGLRTKSPLSLHVTLRQLREGAALDFEDVMVMEYRLSQRFMAGHDFFEGVRAVIVDKDNRPCWQHGSIDEVTAAEIAACFAPLGGDDLKF